MSIEQLKSKMKSLLKAYKASIDNNKQTGAAPCASPFMTEMDEIFGERPIISSLHTLNTGSLSTISVDLTDSSKSTIASCSYDQTVTVLDLDDISESSSPNDTCNSATQNKQIPFKIIPKAVTPVSMRPSPKVKPPKGADHLKKRQVSMQEMLLNKKLDWAREKEKNKQNRFDQRLEFLKELDNNKNNRLNLILASKEK